jgi:alpha-beta hydrolase superfamily lysophospholipase
MQTIKKTHYIEDILANGFENTTIALKEDHEGEVIATLIRKKNKTATNRGVLYIHGFNDYFFQKEMGNEFIKNGYNFYAIDLRKYGRSILPHQKRNMIQDLATYYEELDLAFSIIKEEGNKTVLLYGHSAGGLLATLYANDKKGSKLFTALFCNSPFYSMNVSYVEKKIVIPLVSFLGKYFPNIAMPVRFTKLYGYSLHQSRFGEWDYNLTWKPHLVRFLNAGWINAIHQGHLKIAKGISLDIPILIMHSNKSIHFKRWTTAMFYGDAILNVKEIQRESKKINSPLKDCIAIDNAMHDLVLSRKEIRAHVYEQLFIWLEKLF